MRTRHAIFHACGLSAALLLAACEDYPLHDLGYTTQPSSPAPPEPDPGPPVAQHISELSGVWLGEAEDPFALSSSAELNPPPYRLPSGSTHIWLRIEEPNGERDATITFGDAEPPAPATDPDVGYPQGAPESLFVDDGSLRPPVEGFPYRMSRGLAFRDAELAGLGPREVDAISFQDFEDGELVDGKLELSYLPTEVYESWCSLQTSESCVTDGGYSSDDEGRCYMGANPAPVDCAKVGLCASQVCTCEPGSQCSHSYNPLTSIVVRRSEDGLVGLFEGAVFINERGFQQPLGTVHFRRFEPIATP